MESSQYLEVLQILYFHLQFDVVTLQRERERERESFSHESPTILSPANPKALVTN